MNIIQAIEQLINSSANWNKNRLAKHLNLVPQSLNSRFRPNSSMQVSSAIEMLDPLGYDLVIIPKGSNTPRGSILISNEPIETESKPVGRPKKQPK